MDTLRESFSFRLLSVLELSWEANRRFSHVRPCDALSFRIKGNAEFLFPDAAHPVFDGSVSFVPAGCAYVLDHGSEHLFVIHFEASEEIGRAFFTFRPKNPALYRELFSSVYEIWKEKKPGYYFAAASVFCGILARIRRECGEKDPDPLLPGMRRAADLLRERYTDPGLTVAELARVFGTSPTYFRKAFRKSFGVTPKKYIEELRVRYALELLETGYYKVYEAAEKAGFSDPKYFSRVVKKIKGAPPSLLV